MKVLELSSGAKYYDITGDRFGKLTVLRRIRAKGESRWECKCDCGNIKQFPSSRLRFGIAKDCGCVKEKLGLNRKVGQIGQPRSNTRTFKKKIPNNDGYVLVFAPDHLNAQANGYVFEHIKVMSKVLGRPIKPHEFVHHKNGLRSDNRPDNLELWAYWHPPGQRVDDLVSWALECLKMYKLEVLVSDGD